MAGSRKTPTARGSASRCREYRGLVGPVRDFVRRDVAIVDSSVKGTNAELSSLAEEEERIAFECGHETARCIDESERSAPGLLRYD